MRKTKMKKAGIILASTLLSINCSLTAFAAQQKSTEVSFDVDPSYNVTIPATISLTKKVAESKTTYEEDLEVGADAGVFLHQGEKVQITLSGDFKMETTEGAKLDYAVQVGDTAIANNGVVATFVTQKTAQSSKLHITAPNPEFAGTYEDTVTFNIGVITEETGSN